MAQGNKKSRSVMGRLRMVLDFLFSFRIVFASATIDICAVLLIFFWRHSGFFEFSLPHMVLVPRVSMFLFPPSRILSGKSGAACCRACCSIRAFRLRDECFSAYGTDDRRSSGATLLPPGFRCRMLGVPRTGLRPVYLAVLLWRAGRTILLQSILNNIRFATYYADVYASNGADGSRALAGLILALLRSLAFFSAFRAVPRARATGKCLAACAAYSITQGVRLCFPHTVLAFERCGVAVKYPTARLTDAFHRPSASLHRRANIRRM